MNDVTAGAASIVILLLLCQCLFGELVIETYT